MTRTVHRTGRREQFRVEFDGRRCSGGPAAAKRPTRRPSIHSSYWQLSARDRGVIIPGGARQTERRRPLCASLAVAFSSLGTRWWRPHAAWGNFKHLTRTPAANSSPSRVPPPRQLSTAPARNRRCDRSSDLVLPAGEWPFSWMPVADSRLQALSARGSSSGPGNRRSAVATRRLKTEPGPGPRSPTGGLGRRNQALPDPDRVCRRIRAEPGRPPSLSAAQCRARALTPTGRADSEARVAPGPEPPGLLAASGYSASACQPLGPGAGRAGL